MSTESVVDIFNLALDTAGHKSSVTSQLESSREAEICNRWYPRVYKTVGKAAHWHGLKGVSALALLSTRNTSIAWDSTQPLPNWTFAYALPSDMLAPQYLTDFSRFEMGLFGTGSALLSDIEAPLLVYSKLDASPALWDEGFTNAIIYGLAAVISTPLSGRKVRGNELFQQANQAIMDAREQNANDSYHPLETMPDWLTARGVGTALTTNNFLYPYGALISATSV